jgi:hypothetical protein
MTWLGTVVVGAQNGPAQSESYEQNIPPRVAQAQNFLRQRSVTADGRVGRSFVAAGKAAASTAFKPNPQVGGGTSATSSTWTALGPTAVTTLNFGLVAGRISSIAFDPSDATGNHVYIGTTGGGVWAAQNANASTVSQVSFAPLTDELSALANAPDASISIGALTVQPGGTGVVLAGTGDPNDQLDSYYGAGILRSTDGGSTWSLIPETQDLEDGIAKRDFEFIGEGFAGFAWSTTNAQLVVAAVLQAYEGTVVDALQSSGSYEGLYYSSDSGATWHLATITDGGGQDVQGPLDSFVKPDGNAATAVVWNPKRAVFVAAVRYHGYYESADGITWSRMSAQPGTNLTTSLCPTNSGGNAGSIACPIFRGALAVNPSTGDTFAWTVDANNQDQGLWQDSCTLSGNTCTNASITFARHWNTASLESSATLGKVTIANGNYNLALAAVPSQQDTLLFAGANDLWQCSIAAGCVWRNTTNSTTCMSAGVGEFQHAVAWNPSNALEMFIGNDSGLWRSTDDVGETGAVCNSADASHFQNLNGSLGSLAEVESLSPVPTTPYNLLAGLGVNGAAGVAGSAVTVDWPQVLSGFGGPVAIDPNNSRWYVNGQSGVAIYRCSVTTPCTPSEFGSSPTVNDADVGGDGYAMPTPAPFLVDPLDTAQFLIGTCRVWRGPANGVGWGSSNAISSVLDNASAGPCSGDSLIRSMDAMATGGATEVIYLGMYGAATQGGNLAGHVLSAKYNLSSPGAVTWHDLTLNPVALPTGGTLNPYGFDISSVYIDAHDTTGNTVYLTVEAISQTNETVSVVYRTTNGGTNWTDITANLPEAPANSIAVDPQNANTVYVATDAGVFFTTEAQNCAQSLSNCWTAFGSGLPAAPVVALSASPATSSNQVLVAGTYGRGIWQTGLFTSGVALTAASLTPDTLTFAGQSVGTASGAQAAVLKNTGALPLTVTSIAGGSGFTEKDNCQNQTVAVGASCSIQVTYTPAATGPSSATMMIYANVYGGQLSLYLNGTGTPAGVVVLSTSVLNLGDSKVGVMSATQPLGVTNSSANAIPVTSYAITPPFAIASNTCGASSLTANFTCQLTIDFTPTTSGPVSGILTITDSAGTQTVSLTGTGQAVPTDILNPTSLTLPVTAVGQVSPVSSQTEVSITNQGDLPLTSISESVTGMFVATNGCGTQLAAHSVCYITVQFAPTAVGNQTGTLTITDFTNKADSQTVTLNGTGLVNGVISVSPTSLAFSQGTVGVASAPQTVTVTNSGVATIANIGFQFTGAGAANYATGATTCGAQLNAGSSCTVQVIFTQPATGSTTAALVVSSSTAGVTAVSIPINGGGTTSSGLLTSTSLLTFTPATGVNQTSAAQTVTITNATGNALSSVTLATSGPFTLTANTCTGGLGIGATCTVGVEFAPTVYGAATGALTVSASGVANPVTVQLAGTGFDFTLALTGLASVTVTSGQQADYTMVLTPEAAQGSFTYVCGTLPANALCLFSPATETLSSGVQGDVQVQIYTGGSGLTVQAEPLRGFSALPLLCGLLLLPMALWRGRRFFFLVLLGVMLAGGVSSCTSSGTIAGGSGGAGNSSSTPAGTYTIPVTVTAAGVSHAVSVTLTVD